MVKIVSAEGMGFEPMRGYPLLALQASALDHYANPPIYKIFNKRISEIILNEKQNNAKKNKCEMKPKKTKLHKN